MSYAVESINIFSATELTTEMKDYISSVDDFDIKVVFEVGAPTDEQLEKSLILIENSDEAFFEEFEKYPVIKIQNGRLASKGKYELCTLKHESTFSSRATEEHKFKVLYIDDFGHLCIVEKSSWTDIFNPDPEDWEKLDELIDIFPYNGEHLSESDGSGGRYIATTINSEGFSKDL